MAGAFAVVADRDRRLALRLRAQGEEGEGHDGARRYRLMMPRWLRKLIVVAADVGGAMFGASLGAQPWLAGIVSAGASDIADAALPPVTSP